MKLPQGMGVICRTLGEGKKEEFFFNDIEMLLDIWRNLEEYNATKRAPFYSRTGCRLTTTQPGP